MTTYGLLGEGVVRTTCVTGLEETARGLLEGYHADGACVLLDHGYLDLFGNVWSCTVLGDGWVEVTVIRARPDEAGSDVTTVRMDAGDWAEELGGVHAGHGDAEETQVDAYGVVVGDEDLELGDTAEGPEYPDS